MTKTISIGDIHGKKSWKIINPNKYDKVIFIGDYLDSHGDTDGNDQLDNLLDIIEFKKAYTDKVILLLGNHDIQYLEYPENRCSGFQPVYQLAFTEALRTNRGLFLAAYQIKNYLWTHAGVCNKLFIENIELENEHTIADQLNEDFMYKKSYLFDVSYHRWGIADVGGIFWADMKESSADPLKGYNQIVGHTRVDTITSITRSDDTSIIYIDCLDGGNNFYELNIE